MSWLSTTYCGAVKGKKWLLLVCGRLVPKLLQALPWGREKGRAMPAEPILFTRGIKSGNVPTGGEGRKGRGGGGVMGCGNDEASRSVLKGLLYPRYGKDERLFSKGTVIGGRKKNRNG